MRSFAWSGSLLHAIADSWIVLVCRSDSFCDLNLTDPVCGYDSVAPVDPLSFTVQDNVQVKAVAYKILYDCDGGQCSYTA